MSDPDNQVGTAPRGKRRQVGVLVGDLVDPYMARIVAALHDEAVARDVTLSFFVGGRAGIERIRNDAFAAASPANVDALLVLSVAPSASSQELAELARRYHPLPTCTVGMRCPGLPCVQINNDPAMHAALDHLLRFHGRRRILFLRGPTENTESNARFAIYKDVLRQQGIRWDPSLVLMGEFDQYQAERAVTDYVRTRGTDFDAVMAANDAMALGALRALERADVRVPESVSLFGFDDVEAAWSCSPPLSTVRQPFARLARTALDVVLSGDVGDTTIHAVTGDLVLRRSCGCMSGAIERAGTVLQLAGGTTPEPELASSAAVESAEGWLVRSGASAKHASPFVESLLRATFGTHNPVFTVLETIMAEIGEAGTPIRALQDLLTEVAIWLRLAVAQDADRREALELLLQQARIFCAEAAEREAAAKARKVEEGSRALVAATGALLTTFDVDALCRAIRLELPRLGIPACSLLLYDQRDPEVRRSSAPPGTPSIFGGPLPRYSRALLAYDPREPAVSAAEGVIMRTHHLWPVERAARRSQTIQTLFFDSNRLGLLVLDFVPGNGALHQAVAEMVSAALQGAYLAERVAAEAARRERVERERLEQELEIAARIQSSILPRNIQVEGLDVVASMEPATEVGGDYYDVLPFPGGAWIGIGDVAGHGLRPGIVMVMLQSVVAAVAALSPQARPRDLIHVVNQVLYDNVRRRLEQDEHATLSVIRYQKDGVLSFAGAHEDLIILRAETGRCELIPTDGTWVAATQDIDAVTQDHSARLAPGDVLVLYTDGAIEARNSAGERFGMQRLLRQIEAARHLPVTGIRDQVLATLREFAPVRDDDVALLVARYAP